MRKGDSIKGFELAGADGVYKTAAAEIKGNTIVLRSEEVAKPVSARYMWVGYGEVTLFGANGLPVAPFRTSL